MAKHSIEVDPKQVQQGLMTCLKRNLTPMTVQYTTLEYKGQWIKVERVSTTFCSRQLSHWYARINGKELSDASFTTRERTIAAAKEKIDEQT